MKRRTIMGEVRDMSKINNLLSAMLGLRLYTLSRRAMEYVLDSYDSGMPLIIIIVEEKAEKEQTIERSPEEDGFD